MNRYTFSPAAERDLSEIIAYLEGLPITPANKIGAAIRNVLEGIARNPFQGSAQSELTRLANSEIRSRLVASYRIFYRTQGEVPEVIGILHAARDIRSIMAKRVQLSMSIEQNLEVLRNQIADACARAHRPVADVALMAVSKMHPVDLLLEAHAAGQRLFGENRVQEWQSKSETAASLKGLEMHLIGPLQSNKSARAAELFDAIDTVDSLKLATRLNEAARTLAKKLPIYIEVKLSPEESKHGLQPEELPALLTAIAPLENIIPIGLMTVPPWPADVANAGEEARPYFQHLRRLRDENLAAHPTLTGLSMGMSNDFPAAIQEGSTCVRIGTAIFGKRTAA